MSWVDWWWRLTLIARVGVREHRASNPLRISATTLWPRAVLQCLFYTMLGRVVGGEEGQAFTFVGSLVVIIALFTIGELGDVPMRDRHAATFYRLRLGRLPVSLVYAIRCWPLAAEALLLVVICTVFVGFVTGQGELALQLLMLLPFYGLLVVTSAAMGLALASLGLFGRAGSDVIVGNIAIALIVIASGALIPVKRIPILDAIGTVLPMRNGLQAIRHFLADQPWANELLAELAVGGAWALAAVLIYAGAVRRIRQTDHDKVM